MTIEALNLSEKYQVTKTPEGLYYLDKRAASRNVIGHLRTIDIVEASLKTVGPDSDGKNPISKAMIIQLRRESSCIYQLVSDDIVVGGHLRSIIGKIDRDKNLVISTFAEMSDEVIRLRGRWTRKFANGTLSAIILRDLAILREDPAKIDHLAKILVRS